MFQILYFGTCLTLAAFISAQAAELPARVEVLMKFDHLPSSAIVKTIQREASTLFAPAGITLIWSLWNKKLADSKPDTVLVRFKGKCGWGPVSMSDIPPFNEGLTLARASVRQGQVLPAAEIQCDQVQKLMRPILAGPLVIGTALGRVMAHELYHILGNTISHGPEGLSKTSVSAAELKCKDAVFARHELDLIRGLQHGK